MSIDPKNFNERAARIAVRALGNVCDDINNDAQALGREYGLRGEYGIYFWFLKNSSGVVEMFSRLKHARASLQKIINTTEETVETDTIAFRKDYSTTRETPTTVMATSGYYRLNTDDDVENKRTVIEHHHYHQDDSLEKAIILDTLLNTRHSQPVIIEREVERHHEAPRSESNWSSTKDSFSSDDDDNRKSSFSFGSDDSSSSSDSSDSFSSSDWSSSSDSF